MSSQEEVNAPSSFPSSCAFCFLFLISVSFLFSRHADWNQLNQDVDLRCQSVCVCVLLHAWIHIVCVCVCVCVSSTPRQQRAVLPTIHWDLWLYPESICAPVAARCSRSFAEDVFIDRTVKSFQHKHVSRFHTTIKIFSFYFSVTTTKLLWINVTPFHKRLNVGASYEHMNAPSVRAR